MSALSRLERAISLADTGKVMLSKEEASGLAAFIRGGLHLPSGEPHLDPTLAIRWAVEHEGADCQAFLRLWQEGNFTELEDFVS